MLSAWASRANGGVFEAVAAQAALLRDLGATPVIIAIDDPAHADDRWRLGEAEILLAQGKGPAQLGYAPQLGATLDRAKLDLLHLHGIWQFPSHAADGWARRTGRPLVISPHGMLDPWITGRNAWKKTLARTIWERRSWRSATAFHALTEAEAHDIVHETGGAHIATIANPAPNPSAAPDAMPPANALYLGRIHAKKNIAALVSAWAKARPNLPHDATLTIAGWGDDAGIEMLEHAMGGADTSIQFVGTAFGSQKAALFDVSRFLILPSLSEGLPMAVLDAWAAGRPTIMSDHCHVPIGFEAGAAIRCRTSADEIATALEQGFSLGENEWMAMAVAARALAAGPFGRPAIAGKWEAFYSALLSG
ncbi:glycosyltransferase [Qipengyuania zhejiangensis]|uniref:glycosyltransferase n=1 Tax=Qipengyuania zhejiangensis TaxID=3077782 RepID=UPI002D788FAD|nr:glycosyltransferase [Qipengyuania sp. Z2]